MFNVYPYSMCRKLNSKLTNTHNSIHNFYSLFVYMNRFFECWKSIIKIQFELCVNYKMMIIHDRTSFII